MPSSETGDSWSERRENFAREYPKMWKELTEWYDSLTRVGKLIFILHHAEELSPAEIGEVLGLLEGTVASQLRAYRVRARAIMRAHGVNDGPD
jgi:DNA-directed RNA polymerase specialized sigma24 family protein